MVIQLVYRDHTYNLPKCTLDIMSKINAIGDTLEIEPKAKMMYDFISDALGEDVTKDLIGDSLESADLIELCSLYASIDNAYAAAIRESNPKSDELAGAAESIEKLGGIDNVIKLLDAVNANK